MEDQVVDKTPGAEEREEQEIESMPAGVHVQEKMKVLV